MGLRSCSSNLLILEKSTCRLCLWSEYRSASRLIATTQEKKRKASQKIARVLEHMITSFDCYLWIILGVVMLIDQNRVLDSFHHQTFKNNVCSFHLRRVVVASDSCSVFRPNQRAVCHRDSVHVCFVYEFPQAPNAAIKYGLIFNRLELTLQKQGHFWSINDVNMCFQIYHLATLSKNMFNFDVPTKIKGCKLKDGFLYTINFGHF